MKKFVLLTLLLATIGVATWLFISPTPFTEQGLLRRNDLPLEHISKDSTGGPVFPSRIETSKSKSTPPSLRRPTRSEEQDRGTSAMIHRYSTSTSGRVFVLEAVNYQEKGGAFYASWVVDSCLQFRSLGVLSQYQPNPELVSSTDMLNAGLAINYLQTRCSEFTDNELITYSGRRLLERGFGEGDVLQDALTKLLTAKTHAARRSAIRRVVELRDPLLLDVVGVRMLIAQDKSTAFYQFSGSRYPLVNDGGVSAAVYLLPCKFGLPCDLSDPSLALACVSGASCFSSRDAKMFTEFAGGDPNKADQIRQLAEAMFRAIQNREDARFSN